MNFLKTEKGAALVLLLAAVTGFIIANVGGAPWIYEVGHRPWFGTSLNLHQVVFDFGLSAFFFLVGLELKREVSSGALSPLKNAIPPLFAAVFGVAFPAILYLIFNAGMTSDRGWAIPTATDVTFALAVFVVFGHGLPRSARTFLLAFAVIDDLLAVILISVLFSGISDWGLFAILLVGIAVFAAVANLPDRLAPGYLKLIVCVIFWLLNIRLAMLAGVEPALVGVVMALTVPALRIPRIEDSLHTAVSYVAVPAFAFFAAAVPLGSVQPLESAVFWGIAFRPIGKFLGIYAGGLLGMRFATESMRFSKSDLAAVSWLGGIGFTVSLLIAGLSFGSQPELRAEAVLATFVATLVSFGVGAYALARRSRLNATEAR